MSGDLRPRVRRLQRLLHLRETQTDAAEAVVRESEQEVRRIERLKRGIEDHIRSARQESGVGMAVSGHRLRLMERFIGSLERKNASAQYTLEKAQGVLERRRGEWVETLRRQRIVERAVKRRTQEWRRYEEAEAQRLADDAHSGKVARERRG